MKGNSKKENIKHYRYIIFAVISFAYIMVYFHRTCPAVIALDIQQYFDASGTLVGVLSSAYFYPYALMQLPTGLLVDSWGPRKTVSVFFALAAFGSAMMGLSSVLGMAIFGRILVGFGVSTVFVSNFKLLAEWFEPRKFTIMGGIFMAMGGVGILISTAPLAVVSDRIGWRMTFVVVGMISLIVAGFVYGIVSDSPSVKDWMPISSPLLDRSSTGKGRLFQGLKAVLTQKDFWPIALWAFFVTGIFFALAGLWGGPYLMHVYRLSKASAGGVLSMSAIGLVIGSPFLGFMANLIGRKLVLIGCNLALIMISFIFFLFIDTLPHAMLYILFFCLGLSSAAMAPVLIAYTKELFPLEIAGTSVGVVNLFPFFGGATFQIVFGAILSQGSMADGFYSSAMYQNMFLVCLLSAVLSVGIALLFRETLSRI